MIQIEQLEDKVSGGRNCKQFYVIFDFEEVKLLTVNLLRNYLNNF